MAVSLTFIGNATLLLRYGELSVLTDPNFLHQGQFAYLGKGLVSRRLREPALSIADLPPLSGIVLSHLHGDHWDRVARRSLDGGLPVLTTPAAARALHRQGFRAARGLLTWESAALSHGERTLTVTATPGQHASGLARVLLPPVMGSVLEFARAGTVEHRLYISGDTLFFDGLAEIPRRHPQLGAAVLHLGGTTLPGGLVVTMDAAQGVALMRLLDRVPVVPVHYDDYGVFKSPLADFEHAAATAGLSDRIIRVCRGQTVELP